MIITYWLSKVGPDGKIYGSRSGRTDLEPNISPPTLPLSQLVHILSITIHVDYDFSLFGGF